MLSLEHLQVDFKVKSLTFNPARGLNVNGMAGWSALVSIGDDDEDEAVGSRGGVRRDVRNRGGRRDQSGGNRLLPAV